MFVGHYAVSLALKRFETRASLGLLFLGVQFVDILFFPLVLAGVERMNLVENFTASTHFQLEYMPYTHSLLGTMGWAVAAYALFRWVFIKNHRIALVISLAVFSHWVLDLIVHTPDLPLWSDSSPKLGFGLWNNAIVTYTLEAVLLLGALWLYLTSTTASTKGGKYGMPVFVLLLILVNIPNIFGPFQDTGTTPVAISALTAYFLFAAVAFWLDRKRVASNQ